MIYTDQELLDAPYFADSEGESSYERKIVTTRKLQSCCGDFGEGRHDIAPGTRAIREKCLLEGDGWRSNYICSECASKIIDRERKEYQ
jgi:hypothetical protein